MLQPAAFLAKHLAGSVDSLLTPSYASQACNRAESPLAQHDTDSCAYRPLRLRPRVCRQAASSDCEAAGLALAQSANSWVPRRRSVLGTESHQVPYSVQTVLCVQVAAQQGPQLAGLMEGIIEDRASVALMASAHLTRLDALFAAPRYSVLPYHGLRLS